MARFQKYLKNEFQTQNFVLGHDNVTDFYVTCWQSNSSARWRSASSLPLMCIRTLIFTGCLSTWIASMVITVPSTSAGSWFIFMTHWGVMLNTFTSGFAVLVSVMVILNGPTGEYKSVPNLCWTAIIYLICSIALLD